MCLRIAPQREGKLDICFLTPVLHWLKAPPGEFSHGHHHQHLLLGCSAPEELAPLVLDKVPQERSSVTWHLRL